MVYLNFYILYLLKKLEQWCQEYMFYQLVSNIVEVSSYISYFYYDLKLGSGCNLDKDLRIYKGLNQLVKHRDTRIYLHYI